MINDVIKFKEIPATFHRTYPIWYFLVNVSHLLLLLLLLLLKNSAVSFKNISQTTRIAAFQNFHSSSFSPFRKRGQFLTTDDVKLILATGSKNTILSHDMIANRPSYDRSRWVNWTLTRMCSHEYTFRVLVPENRYECATDPSFNFHSNIWVQTKMISCYFCPTDVITDQWENFLRNFAYFLLVCDVTDDFIRFYMIISYDFFRTT